MTDLPAGSASVPSRLGVSARLVDGDLVLDLVPGPELLHHGVVRTSVVTFLVDAGAGIPIDDDPTSWTLTTDLTVRMRPVPAPAVLSATSRVVREGKRSVTCVVDVTGGDGELLGSGAIGFARVPRRATDPPKPRVTPGHAVALFDGSARLDRPLREAAGVEVLDAAAGVVQLEVTSAVRNPAGTLQGAMVALVAEAATEEAMAALAGTPVVVTDLDLRYLARTGRGPVRTSTRLLGDGPGATVEVRIVDVAADQLTTLVHARTAIVG
jgi:acyl-coenzyme A thioesterase PaaI-like protein